MKDKGKGACEGSTAKGADPRRPSREEKEARKDARRAARRRADLVRGSALARCLMRKVIDSRMFEAGCEIRRLCVEARPGVSAPALREKVDGGRGPMTEPVWAMSESALASLRKLIVGSAMGAEAAEVVLKVCGEDMFLTAVAIELEESKEARANGACSRETIAITRHLLRSGLTAAWHHMKRREPARRSAAVITRWLAEDARPSASATQAGERPDLGAGASSATRSGRGA
jgi:hypothetical protein